MLLNDLLYKKSISNKGFLCKTSNLYLVLNFSALVLFLDCPYIVENSFVVMRPRHTGELDPFQYIW